MGLGVCAVICRICLEPHLCTLPSKETGVRGPFEVTAPISLQGLGSITSPKNLTGHLFPKGGTKPTHLAAGLLE